MRDHLPLPVLTERDARRFFAKLAVRGTSDCWEWTASRVRNGYGRFGIGERVVVLAHRVAFALGFGIDPGTAQVDHTCHNRACCNPLHLRLTTHKQNAEHLKGPHADNASGVLGVCWDKQKARWMVRASSHGQTVFGGYFIDIQEAESAAIALRLRLFTHNDKDRRAA